LRNSPSGAIRRRSSTLFLARWRRTALNSMLPDSPQLVVPRRPSAKQRENNKGAVMNEGARIKNLPKRKRCRASQTEQHSGDVLRATISPSQRWIRPRAQSRPVTGSYGRQDSRACPGRYSSRGKTVLSKVDAACMEPSSSDIGRAAMYVAPRHSHLDITAEEAVRNRAPSPRSMAAAHSGRAAAYVRAPQKPTHEKRIASR
jgi:hypothetical protein